MTVYSEGALGPFTYDLATCEVLIENVPYRLWGEGEEVYYAETSDPGGLPAVLPEWPSPPPWSGRGQLTLVIRGGAIHREIGGEGVI